MIVKYVPNVKEQRVGTHICGYSGDHQKISAYVVNGGVEGFNKMRLF
jgi:hypothetical protein